MIAIGETRDVAQMIRDLLAERRRDEALKLAGDVFDPAPTTVGELNRFLRILLGELPRRSRGDALLAIAGSSSFARAVEAARPAWLKEMQNRVELAAKRADDAYPREDHAFWVLPRAERSARWSWYRHLRAEHTKLWQQLEAVLHA